MRYGRLHTPARSDAQSSALQTRARMRAARSRERNSRQEKITCDLVACAACFPPSARRPMLRLVGFPESRLRRAGVARLDVSQLFARSLCKWHVSSRKGHLPKAARQAERFERWLKAAALEALSARGDQYYISGSLCLAASSTTRPW